MRNCFVTNHVTAGLTDTQHGLQMTFCRGDKSIFTAPLPAYTKQNIAEFITNLALSDNGIYFAVYRPLCDSNGFILIDLIRALLRFTNWIGAVIEPRLH